MSVNMQQSDYRFYAFISYSRKNEKEAKWLQKKLETYRLPTVLQKQYSELPKSLKIFRDKTDIGVGGTVASALSRELQDSKKLIVLCSPDSAKSEYVEYEIESFIKLGRSSDDILPFVVAGEIKRGVENDCYGAKLHELNLNAADSVQEGKGNAFVRLLASLLGIKYDDLKKRERARAIRKNCFLGTACAAIVAFASAVAWYVTPHTRYYADYVTRWGIPEGIGKPLSKKEANHLFEYYEIISQCGRPIKLAHKDFYGRVSGENPEYKDRPRVAEYSYEHLYNPFLKKSRWHVKRISCEIDPNDGKRLETQKMQIVFEYMEDSSVLKCFYFDADGAFPKRLSNNILSTQCIYYSDVANLMAGVWGDEDFENMPDKILLLGMGNIYRHKIKYDSDGLESEVLFYNNYNQPVSDKNGILGYDCNYDASGFLVRQSYRYEDYNSDSALIAYKKFTYDGGGKLNSVGFCKRKNDFAPKKIGSMAIQDEEGIDSLILNKALGYAFMTIDRTKDSEQTTEIKYSFYDEKKESIFEAVYGASCITDVINSRGERIREVIVTKDGVQTWKNEYNHTNKSETVAVYLDDVFVSRKVVFYNIDGRTDLVKFYDSEIETNPQIEEYEYKRNEKGDIAIVVKNDSGFSAEVYDKYGRHIAQSFGNEKVSGLVRVQYEGANCSILYFKNGKVYAPYNNFYARADFSYHSTGTLQSALFRDESGNKLNHPLFGFAEYTASFYNNGILRHAEFKDDKGKLTTSKLHGYAYYDANLDLNDKYLVSGFYATEDGKTIVPKKLAFKQDEHRFVSDLLDDSDAVIRYYDFKGFTHYWKVYNSSGDRKFLIFCQSDDNSNYMLSFYTPEGIMRRTEYHNRAGVLVNRPGHNYSIINRTYFENGDCCVDFVSDKMKIVSQSYYDKFGKVIKSISYEDNGDCQVMESFDEKGRFTSLKKYDSANVLVIESNFEYASDGSIVQYNKNYDDEKHLLISVMYRKKTGESYDNDEGWALKEDKFVDGVKRTRYFNSSKDMLLCKSGSLLTINKVYDSSSSMQAGVNVGDILLVLGNFYYFENGSWAQIMANDPNSEKLCVIYSVSKKRIITMSGTKLGFDINEEYPTDSEETSLKYIDEIKKVYDDWKKTLIAD